MIALLILLSFIIISRYCTLIFKWNVAWNKIATENFSSIESMIKLSVIIPVRNEEANIERVLNSLLNQTYPKHLFEIIISDDCSTDATVTIANIFFSEHPTVIGKIIEAN